MKKRFFFTIIGVVVLIGLLAGIKALQIRQMIKQGGGFTPPPEVVTTASVQADTWEKTLTSVGSLTAVQGVTVTAELSGKIVRISFEPGTLVRAGDLLVQQDTSTEEAQLREAEAAMSLAKINLDRLSQLQASKSISPSEYDAALARHRQAVAQCDNIRAVIDKKNIRAPFAGRLGIRLINLGQVLKEGEAIVSLQSLDPIFVNFLLPQQQFAQVQTGLTVRVIADAMPDQAIEGKITAVNPEVDAASRNLRVQATVANPQELLHPGMFVNVAVVLPARNKVLIIPATAVLYAPYSDSVFVVDEQQDEKSGQTGKVLRQQFVQLGEKRGDFVAVVAGLKEGETVVTTGVFKLRPGQAAVVDNTLSPDFKLAPRPEDN